MSILHFAAQSHEFVVRRMTKVEGTEEMSKSKRRSFIIGTSPLIRASSLMLRHSYMSKTVPPRPIVIDGKRRFIIVARQCYARYVEGLVDHAKEDLHYLAP